MLACVIWFNVTAATADTLKLSMAKSLSMEFVPVCVNTNNGLYDWKQVKLGDAAGGFKEYPTTMALGGSFPLEENGKKMWCYYIGKYEVTQRQYDALMMPEKAVSQNKKVYPVTNVSWFDALEFANRYNQWLFANVKDTLPKFDTSYGFVRLPTEAEWEFAARGGSAVSADVFDQKIPYPINQIQKYEWFGGASSSHYKLQPVGKLKPNPLGIHDMLGNADEITMSLFSVEYYQGRIGGFVIKGNNYMTAKNKLRSAFRTELPFYRADKEGLFKHHKKKTLGFRLVISALVFPSRKIQKEMSDEWESYRSKLGASTPAGLSTSSTSAKTSVGGKKAFVYLERLKKRLKEKGIIDSEIENNLGNLGSSIQDVATIRLNADKEMAYLLIKMGNNQADHIKKETRKLPLLNTRIGILTRKANNMEKLAQYRARKIEHMTNIKNSLSNYSESIRQISTLSKAAVKVGFKRYLNHLLSKNLSGQIKLLSIEEKHYDNYEKNKRVDVKQWERDIVQ